MRTLPDWLKKKLVCNDTAQAVHGLLSSCGLHTVCSSALCPNKGECFGRGTAAFLILGDTCTRKCGFCAVKKGLPSHMPDESDVQKIISAVKAMKLLYAVITSVTRDDLADGGASHFYDVIAGLKRTFPYIKVEVLVPDFNGDMNALKEVVNACPDVLNHNLETVSSLYPTVRMGADYTRSLKVLQAADQSGACLTKSGIMLGLGESFAEVINTLEDLRSVGCSILTLGQYLRPSKNHLPVKKYISPHAFDRYKQIALNMGFNAVESGPFVRSSYKAKESFERVIQ
ncbi:MAG: lipoyl synthase [bacterium]